MQVRAEIKDLAQIAEARMRSKAKDVLAGNIPHLKQMAVEDLIDGIERNFKHLVGDAATPAASLDEAPKHLADMLNYGLALIARL
jgi:hypothetical protein